MKKLIFPVLALAAALTVSCNKEQGTESPAAKASQKVTIEASIAGTKTAYANNKTFSWLTGDKISVMEDLDGTVKFNEFTAASEGPTTTFDGEISDGATLGQWAVYPSNLNPQVTDGALSVTLPRYYMLDVQGEDVASGYISSDNPMANLPLVGQKQEDGKYKFSTAMGVVKFSFTNVPDEVAYVSLTANEIIGGTFVADENGVFSLNSTDGGNNVFFQVTPTEQHTIDVYLPMPVGTLTTGLKVELLGGDFATPYLSKTTVSDIEVVRNRVTEVAALEVQYSGLTLQDILGTYTVTGTSPWADDDGNYDVTSTFTIAENPYEDLLEYGNVIITGSIFGVPTNYLPVFATFNPVDGQLSISTWVPIYQNSNYVEPEEGAEEDEEEDPNNFQYIYIMHFFVDEEGIGSLDDPVVFQFTSADEFESDFEGYFGLYMDSGYVFDMFNPITGTRNEDIAEEDDEVIPAGAPAKARRISMPVQKGNISPNGKLVKMK